MRACLAVCLAALASAPAGAQDAGDGAWAAYPVLRLDASARAAALAGAADALPGPDPAAAFYNPALLSDEAHRALSVSYLNHQLDVRAGAAVYARTVRGVGTVAAGLRFLSYGEFERADEGGAGEGTFGGGETAFTLAAARPLAENLPGTGTLRGGAALHAAFASLDDARGRALAADLGLVYDLAGPALTVAAAVHNLPLATSAIGETNDRLPVDLRVSVAKRLRYIPLTVSVTGYELQDLGGGDASALHHLNAGGELRLGRVLTTRFGYNFRRHEALDTGGRLNLGGLSAGFGLAVRRVALDYAYHGWSGFGALHQFAVRTRL